MTKTFHQPLGGNLHYELLCGLPGVKTR